MWIPAVVETPFEIVGRLNIDRREFWLAWTDSRSGGWREFVDGSWVAERREGDAAPHPWPELHDPERFPLPRAGGEALR